MAKRDLVELLVRLFGDAELQARWKRDQQKVMRRAGLSKAERELLTAGDEAAIRAYLGKKSRRAVIKTGAAVIKTSAAVIKTSAAVIKISAVGKKKTKKAPSKKKTPARKPKK